MRSVKERFAGVHPPYVVARGSKLLDAAFQNCGFSDMKKTCAGSRGKIVKWRFSAPGFPLEVSLYLLASEAAQVHVNQAVVCNSRLALELCTRCFASEVVQVKVVKRMSSVQGFIFEG